MSPPFSFYIHIDYGHFISWENYYNGDVSFNDIKNHIIDYELEGYVNESFKNYKLLPLTYEEHYTNELQKINNVTKLSLSDLKDSEFWLDCLNHNEYFPYLMLSDGYFKLQEINGNTEHNLFEIAQAVTLAYLVFFTNTTKEEMIEHFKCVFLCGWNEKKINCIWDQSRSDLKMLQKEYIRLENI